MENSITCQNEYCLYWEDNACILDQIELNVTGVCETCIQVEMDRDTLDARRRAQLARMENGGQFAETATDLSAIPDSSPEIKLEGYLQHWAQEIEGLIEPLRMEPWPGTPSDGKR